MKKTVTVVGCGIIGLTSAVALQERGYKVRMIAKKHFRETVSHRVGAIWFPYSIQPIEKANSWAKISYQRYSLETAKNCGVAMVPFMVVFDEQSNNDWVRQLPKDSVKLCTKEELPAGIKQAYSAIVPLVEPPIYLEYLYRKFQAAKGEFEAGEFKSLEELANLDTAVVNCSGLGARGLCNDPSIYPIRGQILKCKKTDLSSMVDSTKKGELLYVINRSNDCVIGGTDYEQDWNEEVDKLDTSKILGRLQRLGVDEEPIILEETVGLRPMRPSVRCEFDPDHSHIFHNYGHGGGGFTVAWGCAADVVNSLRKNLS